MAAAAGTAAAAAGTAIVKSQTSLIDGQLAHCESGAVPGSNVSVNDGPSTGPADAHGNFSISTSGGQPSGA